MMADLPPPFASGRTAEVFDWQDGKILKLYRAEFPTDWVEYEYKIARAVCAVGADAPLVYDLIEVNGRRGIVYQRIQGSAMVDLLPRHPLQMAAYARQMADIQFEMHQHAIQDLPAYHEQLAFFIRRAETLESQWKDKALARLASLPEGSQLCHGDFHPGNILLGPQGAVVIDWTNATRGNPWADVARTCLMLQTVPISQKTPGRPFLLLALRIFRNAYLTRYLSHKADPERQIQAWLPIMAAARLDEKIVAEEEALMRIVYAGL
jgi:aminoglycoside phosphotransferase (APT) family kinase protein